ncbi:SRPBCC family protein [Limibaculum sp. M0105]|uniref:SRPBCC family protein n=1 Tax=Thermohalobaculum xanthum TaxID=2753746 RepID=A0A8J7M618_9RHOB|nr:SRPBCC family protein [Thermohalobaculum xanthum]MBK0398886.1 SRPBCC family protein [Thermohalobaculum xanthum]
MSFSDSHDRVSRMLRLAATANDVWAEIGDFGALADWHPVVTKCEVDEIDGDTYRVLTTADGARLLEMLVEAGPRHYTYRITESPLPVDDYRSTLSVVPEPDGGCHVYWGATFEPTDPSADDVVGGIYDAGFEALRDRFGA